MEDDAEIGRGLVLGLWVHKLMVTNEEGLVTLLVEAGMEQDEAAKWAGALADAYHTRMIAD